MRLLQPRARVKSNSQASSPYVKNLSNLNCYYQNAFNHTADVPGMDYWLNELAIGSTIGGVAAALIAGANASDSTVLDAKGFGAYLFSQHIDTAVEANAYNTNNGKFIAKHWLSTIYNTPSMYAALNNADATIAAIVQSSGLAFAAAPVDTHAGTELHFIISQSTDTIPHHSSDAEAGSPSKLQLEIAGVHSIAHDLIA